MELAAEPEEPEAPKPERPPRPSWPSRQPIVVGRPSPAFEPRSVDPAYRATPYRPDTILDGWSTGAFTVRAASLRGHLHRYDGAPRQDDFALALRHDVDRLVVGVADGVSGAAQSHLGATTAVRYATQWLASGAAESAAEIDWKALVESTAWALIEQAAPILGEPTVDAVQAEQVFATTLVCAVVDADDNGELTAHVVGVGDSGAWVLDDDGFTRIEGGKSELEGGLSSSAVSGLPRVPRQIDVATVTIRSGQVLLLGTDGFGDPLGGGQGDVGRLFAAVLRGDVPSITEFGHVLDFSRETFDDDRTLVAVWPGDGRSSGS